jgi:gamma-glutamyltranspeptidase/glutathione hydrolase
MREWAPMINRQSPIAVVAKHLLRLGMAATLAGCSTGSLFSSEPDVPVGQEGNVRGFLGTAVADEPQAALVGRRILSSGGSAADAVAAMGFTLAVTLPSRASLGAGGACLVFDPSPTGPGRGLPEALLFDPVAPANPGRADRPASVPMLARGMLAMQARYGALPPGSVIGPAELSARFGVPVSRALHNDLAVVAGPLAADPGARAVFFANGQPLAEGALLLEPELGATLAQIRQVGIGDLYQGRLARLLQDAMPSAGGGLTVADMRAAVPRFSPAWNLPSPGEDFLVLLPASERGAAPTAAALLALFDKSNDLPAAQRRALAVAAAARQGDAANENLLKADLPAGAPGPLPASTTFAALDRNGGAAVCGVSLGNLFGTGRVAQGTGILLGASPSRAPAPLLSLAMQVNRSQHAFHAMSAGSGQEGAPLAAATGLFAGLAAQLPAQPPEPGRANVVACPGYLPGNDKSCIWSADPRGFGLAKGAD